MLSSSVQLRFFKFKLLMYHSQLPENIYTTTSMSTADCGKQGKGLQGADLADHSKMPGSVALHSGNAHHEGACLCQQ